MSIVGKGVNFKHPDVSGEGAGRVMDKVHVEGNTKYIVRVTVKTDHGTALPIYLVEPGNISHIED